MKGTTRSGCGASATGERLSALHVLGAEGLTGVAFSADGSKLITAALSGTASIWSAETGKLLLTLTGHTDRISSAAFTPDGQMLVTSSQDKSGRIWDLNKNQILARMDLHNRWAPGFLPPIRIVVLLAVSKGSPNVSRFDAATGKLLDVIKTGGPPEAPAFALAISPDEKHIAVGGYDLARVMDLDSRSVTPYGRLRRDQRRVVQPQWHARPADKPGTRERGRACSRCPHRRVAPGAPWALLVHASFKS